MLVLEWKERAFIEKVNSRCFCWFPATILVQPWNGTPIWRLHTKLDKGSWNVSANNSETVAHKDLRLGQIFYVLVFYNISFSWLLPLPILFLLRDSENDLKRFALLLKTGFATLDPPRGSDKLWILLKGFVWVKCVSDMKIVHNISSERF